MVLQKFGEGESISNPPANVVGVAISAKLTKEEEQNLLQKLNYLGCNVLRNSEFHKHNYVLFTDIERYRKYRQLHNL